MESKRLAIIGICRFSYLGFGDWRAQHAGRDGRTNDEIIEGARQTLFAPLRLEARFATFEHLTLPSLAAQTDPDFRLIVLTSEELPAPYAARLTALAEHYPFVHLVFAPIARASQLVIGIYEDLGLTLDQVIQFRIDDDDALGKGYIERLRLLAEGMHAQVPTRAFAVTFPWVLSVFQDEGEIRFLQRFYLQCAAGQAMYHPTRSVLDWAHHLVTRKLLTISDCDGMWVLQSFLTGHNDSVANNAGLFKIRSMEAIKPALVGKVLKRHFPFITPRQGDWDAMIAPAIPLLPSPEAPQS